MRESIFEVAAPAMFSGKKLASYCSIVVLLVFSGCTPSLLTRRVDIQPTLAPPSSGIVAVISKIDFLPTNNEPIPYSYLQTLKDSVRNAIYNSGRFSEALLGKRPVNNSTQAVYVDMQIVPEDRGGINWWLAWPAVYPMPIYWPLQPRSGTANVSMAVEVRQPNGISQSFTVDAKRAYNGIFYGFFRTSMVEDALARCYEDCLNKLTAAFVSLEMAVVPTQPKGVPTLEAPAPVMSVADNTPPVPSSTSTLGASRTTAVGKPLIVAKPGSVTLKKELIYSGKVGEIIEIISREYAEDPKAPLRNQDFYYFDLTASRLINVDNYTIQVREADKNSITYEVITNR